MATNKLDANIDLKNVPCQTLKGVGPKLAEKLEKLHIHSVLDLLLHLPHRYEDRTKVQSIANLRDGERAMLRVTIESNRIQFGKRRSLVCQAFDDSAAIEFRFFYFNKSQQERLQRGAEYYAFGEVKRFGTTASIIHPELTPIDHSDGESPLLESLTPVYPTTDGLHQASWRQLMKQALTYLAKHPISDLLPSEIAQHFKLPELNQSLSWLHSPPSSANLEQLQSTDTPAVKRLVVEELLAHQMALMLQRLNGSEKPSVPFNGGNKLTEQLLENLPFELTNAQQRVCAEIRKDLDSDKPMLRLLQGDVGAGKTLVAINATLAAVESGYQAAIMAPTELLAEQHMRSFSQQLTPLGIRCVFLTGKLSSKEKKEAYQLIESGEAQIIIGTHALFQKDVNYHNLALAIIDEQHRFGVNQRLALKQKAPADFQLHQLMMTATPIPRTLAMTQYADMDVSIIDELPPGRTPVSTVALSDQRRDQVITRIDQACQTENRQVYWVCTLIEESEELQCQAAESTANLLSQELPNCRVGLIHGRLKSEQKQMVMEQFSQGNIDVLVATTVIEVGVDVPNASLMVIENPERLGLAQLHQLRGRVGRGTVESHCVLLYQQPLSEQSKARIQVMRETNDGFVIAEEDLRLRGPGEVLGTRQTGEIGLRFAHIIRDAQLIPTIQEFAKQTVENKPNIAQQISQRWLGDRQDFAEV